MISILPFILGNGQAASHHNGHSHNDYKQIRPLFDALSFGFISVEADISPFRGELRVAHGLFGLKKSRTLDELYLLPLDSLINRNNGTVFPADSTVFNLMIDFKFWKKKSLPILIQRLDEYEHHLYKRRDGVSIWGPVRIILSGNPPMDILEDKLRDYIFLGGRAGKIYPKNLENKVILLSSSYNTLKHSRNSIAKIAGYVKSSEVHGRKVRFWALPNKVATWKFLDNLGVHWIHVDNLKKFTEYRRQNPMD